jgi:hypothetical protein
VRPLRCELSAARSFTVAGAGQPPVAVGRSRWQPMTLLYSRAVRLLAWVSCVWLEAADLRSLPKSSSSPDTRDGNVTQRVARTGMNAGAWGRTVTIEDHLR